MRLGGKAAHLADINTKEEVAEAVGWAQHQNLSVIMIGDGSNIVWGDEGWPGLVMVNKIMDFRMFDEDKSSVFVTIGSGEHWDSVVERTVAEGLHGIEALSLIPGTAGATPVQNVGAYGQEISETLVSLEAYDKDKNEFVTLKNVECGFAYRSSRFKTTDKSRFFIVSITLKLTRANPEPPFYESVQTYFDQKGLREYSPQTLRDAVMAIRSSKLPNPDVVANNGSFFTNPSIEKEEFEKLRKQYPSLSGSETKDGKIKLSAAELIELAGFKDMHDQETGMATWPKQALVLINEHAKNTADLLKFKQKIVQAVDKIFGVTLVQEPEMIGQK